jgi:hypothetical protein
MGMIKRFAVVVVVAWLGAVPVLAASHYTYRAAWNPPPGTTWQIQLSGRIKTSFNVQMYDIDLFDTSKRKIKKLKAAGRVVICYFSAGSFENWRKDAGSFPGSVKGKPLDGWAGESWLDIRRLDILGPIMEARLDRAVRKGCDGVDPDNVDGYTNKTGFPLTYADQLTYNTWLANAAHARGLSVGLKNDVDQINDLVGSFDFAVNEECFTYSECGKLTPFVQAGKAVFGIEYKGNPAVFCPKANSKGFSTLKKKLNLKAAVLAACWTY